MAGCIVEEDLLELIRGSRSLGDTPSLEAHLANCPSCSTLLATLLAEPRDGEEEGWGNLVGRSLGPYRLDAQIGAGAAGEVYRAWDQRLNRHVAVKVLSPRVAASAEQVRRLEAEGRAAASIAHPNVVTVYDVGSIDGVPFIVSELIEGETLRSLIDRRAVPREQALKLGLQLIRGLAAAHARGVVHRDLKPGNLLVTREGMLKILDFGLAKLTGPHEGPSLETTLPGTVLGTVGYLSPEQARGEPADPRSDIFAVGAILYELLSGQRAFDGATFAERLSSVLRDTPPGLDAATLGSALPIVARCLEKDARRRFQSAEDLAWALEEVLRDSGTPAAPAHVRPEQVGAARAVSRRALLTAAMASGIGGVLVGRVLAPGRTLAPAAVQPTYQQLTYRHGRITNARFTRDGGSAVYAAAWDEQPLALFTTRLGGGGTRRLELPSADVLALSSRGQLALGLERRYVEGFHVSGQLALVPIEGGEPRLIAHEVQEADFSPDGSEVAIIRRGGRGFRLEYPLGHTLFESEGWLSHARISPDGQRVACLQHPSPMDDRGAVLIVERATGTGRTLSDGWSSLAGLAWAPDGRELRITATRGGANNALHAISLEGRETFIAETTGRLRLHDISREGLTLVTHDTWRLRMMVRAPGSSRDVDLSLSDLSMVGDISADGSAVTFAEVGDIELERGGYLRPTRGGQALRLGDLLPLALSPDGRRVAALVPGPSTELVTYTPATGEQHPVPLGLVETVHQARWRGDAQLIFVGATSGRPPRLWLAGKDVRAPVPLTDEGVFGDCHVSPDGTRVALIDGEGRCLLVDVDDPGAPQVVPGRYRDERVCGFHAGGTEVFLRGTAIPIRIRRLDITTGQAVLHAEIMPPALGLKGVDSLVLSASGDAYAYSYGQELNRLYSMSGPRNGEGSAAQ